MKKEIEQKCLYAMQLAMRINPEYVGVDGESDGKPTVCVEFSGVTCGLNVYIYPDGFGLEKELETVRYSYDAEYGDDEEVLDGIIKKLEDIYEKWGVKDE